MYCVGIDVAKDKSTVCIMRPNDEQVMKPYDMEHTETELYQLIEVLNELDGEVKVVMEATGSFHLPVLMTLKEAGIFVCVMNPYVTKKYASTILRKGKTDKIDSIRLANFGIDNWYRLQEYKASEVIYAELRFLNRQYHHYAKIRSMCKLSLINILNQTMPGIQKFILFHTANKRGIYKLGSFAARYNHFDNITNMGEDEFVHDCHSWAIKEGFVANDNKARSIYHHAENSITTLPLSHQSTALLIEESVSTVHQLNHIMDGILNAMRNLANKLPEYEVVLEMNGVGDKLASQLIAEIGDVRRFHSGKALVAFAGLDAPPFESGTFVGSPNADLHILEKQAIKL